ncbi:MAG: bifunctional hydroxymethylpyrimidine kinase/phosphomethylpyrimidine kinase [Nitrosopumilus sp.]|nr:bifunctional hydroxymethylpyrimidine kinase/phosphomethylpyrimidine kinase [Nitrosopumilus sp.]
MNLLSIGGSDPSSGAGIQSDVKTFATLNVYGLTIITAITSQNTSKFGMIQPVSKKLLKAQLDSIFSDFKIDGIKIGMVYNAENIKLIYDKIKSLSVPIIVDPVIISSTGGKLIQKSAIKDFKKYLIPIATVITPNKFEAEFISKIKIHSKKSLQKVVKEFQGMGTKSIIITGLELKKNIMTDFVVTENQYFMENKKINMSNHGSGCNYSASMLFALAQDKSILESAKFAKRFTFDSIKNAQKIGGGLHITQKQSDKLHSELSNAINNFIEIKNIFLRIPECQSNFVFSKKSPKSITDILGISGRIVKTGEKVTKVGNLEYGGSKHVATAILTMNKKFPHIRSAINLKFQKETIAKLEKNRFIVKNYDRVKEPITSKSKEGSSIKWGITESLRDSKEPPDAIFHKGDFGKEPMIIIFGTNPKSVIEKISKIF